MHCQVKKMCLILKKENQKLKLIRNNKFKEVKWLESICLKKMNNSQDFKRKISKHKMESFKH